MGAYVYFDSPPYLYLWTISPDRLERRLIAFRAFIPFPRFQPIVCHSISCVYHLTSRSVHI